MTDEPRCRHGMTEEEADLQRGRSIPGDPLTIADHVSTATWLRCALSAALERTEKAEALAEANWKIAEQWRAASERAEADVASLTAELEETRREIARLNEEDAGWNAMAKKLETNQRTGVEQAAVALADAFCCASPDVPTFLVDGYIEAKVAAAALASEGE